MTNNNDAAASGEWRVACGICNSDIAGCVMSCDMMYRSLSTL